MKLSKKQLDAIKAAHGGLEEATPDQLEQVYYAMTPGARLAIDTPPKPKSGQGSDEDAT